MTAPIIEHDARLIRRHVGPLGYCWQLVCSCGAASPQAMDKFVAIIARRSHLTEVGKAGEGDE